MNSDLLFSRIAAISAIISAPVTIAASIVLANAVDFDFDILSNPADLIMLNPESADTFRWGSLLELGAPTLLIVPATLYLWYWLKPRGHKLVTLYTVLGLAGLFFAAIGALIRASIYPPIIEAYAEASEEQAETLLVIFNAVTDFTFEGVYSLELILWGLSWLGIGLILRGEQRYLGIVTAVLGIAFFAAGFGWMLRVDALARLETVFFLVPIWAIWLGIVILRRAGQDVLKE